MKIGTFLIFICFENLRSIAFKTAILIFFITSSLLVKAQIVHQSDIYIADFRVVINAHKVDINWSTDSMQPTNYFEVEKSSDGKNFITVAYVLGADPAKTDCNCYGCFDKINKKDNKYPI